MAISTSFSSFFSFLFPQTKPQLPLFSQFPSHHNNHRNNKIIPFVLIRNETTSSPVTSSPPPSQPPPPKEESSDFTDFTSSSLFSTFNYNIEVVLEDDEPEDRMLGRFRREVMSAGIIQETKRRNYFENKQDEKKRRVRDNAKRNRRMRFPRRPPPGGGYNDYRQDRDREDIPTPEEEDDDSWDIPEEDVLMF